jgi:hypothetical protein
VPHDLGCREEGKERREKEQKVRGTFKAVKSVLQIFVKICLKNYIYILI